MATEELLKPRYKVIADWPEAKYKVGEILIPHEGELQKIMPDVAEAQCKMLDKYPHLFKKLEWYEDREVSEMPEYVKEEGGKIHRATWKEGAITENGKQPMRMECGKNDFGDWQVIPNIMCFYEPATKEEYDSFIKSKSLSK